MSTKPNVAKIEAALRKVDGRPAAAARLLKMTPKELRDLIARFPQLAQLISDIQETLLDQAESVIIRDMRNYDAKAAMWFLEQRGQSRGYGKQPKAAPIEPDPEKEKRRAEVVRTIYQQLEEWQKQKSLANSAPLTARSN